MEINYKELIKEINNASLRKAMELIFTKTFPDMIEYCGDESASANLFISFSELLGEKRDSDSEINFENSTFYNIYPDFCNDLFDMLDCVSESDSEKSV